MPSYKSKHVFCYRLSQGTFWYTLVCVAIIQTTLYVTINFYVPRSVLPEVNYLFQAVIREMVTPCILNMLYNELCYCFSDKEVTMFLG
jgi:hypothetical protein